MIFKKRLNKTLSNEIRQKIKRRIYIALLLTSLLPIVFMVYYYINTINFLKNDIFSESKNLGDYIVGQYLVNNQDAIKLKIDSFNATHNSCKITWEKSKPIPLTKSFHTSFKQFTAIYPLNIEGVSNTNFGHLLIKGDISLISIVNHSLLEMLIIMLVFAILFYFLLVPLATQIPEELIIEPIQHILSIIGKKNEKSINNKVSSDFSEIVTIELQIKDLISVIEKQSQNAAIGLLAREIAHDIQSPLSTLQYCKDKLSSIVEVDEKLLKSLKISIDSIKYILINLLNLNIKQSKKEYEKSDTVYTLFYDLIDNIIIQKSMEYHDKCEFKVNNYIKNKLLWLFINPEEFKNKLSNLISNAFEATEFNKKIRYINFSISNDNEYIYLKINDNGCGISNEILEKIKDGYTNKIGGNGIGLKSAIKFFDDNNGKLMIDSIPNQYTTINIHIRISQAPSWFPTTIYLHDFVVVLDDDPSIHYYIQSNINRLLEVKYFTQISQLKDWLYKNENIIDKTTFFIDFHIEDGMENGLELINNTNINATSYLLTNEYNVKTVQQNATKFNIKMIPKTLIHLIAGANLINQ